MIENLFVIFAPGLGGNHLANLLALTDRFQRSVDFEGYSTDETTAHFCDIVNLRVTSIEANLDKLVNQSNVLCGHIGEYLWFKDMPWSSKFLNKKFLIVSVPEKNTLAFSRFIKYIPAVDNEYFYQEQKTLYTQNVLEKLLEETDFFQIRAEQIFDRDIESLIEFLEQQFSSTIKKQLALDIHSAWMSKLLSK